MTVPDKNVSTPTALGGAPTTAQDSTEDQIVAYPAAVDNQPSTGQPQPPAGQPAAGQPQQNQNQVPAIQRTLQPTPDQPHPVSRMFDSILKTISGGPIYVTDPQTGERKEVQQTKGSMARAITAAALAGMFAPTAMRESAMGGQVKDAAGTIANAGQAGMQARNQREQQAQQIVDGQNSRKLLTMQSNAKMAVTMAALAHQKHQDLDAAVERAKNTYSAPLDAYDSQRPAGEPSIYAARSLSDKEVLASGHRLDDNSVYPDNIVDVMNPETGVMEGHPTYSIVRTTDAKGQPIRLQLPKSVTDELGKFNKGYEQAYSLTDGNVMVPINNYMAAIQLSTRLQAAEGWMNRINQTINGKDAKPVDLAGEYKKNPQVVSSAIDTLISMLGAGQGSLNDGKTVESDDMLRHLLTTKGGPTLVGMLGSPVAVNKWMSQTKLDRMTAESEAKGAGAQDVAEIRAKAKADADEHKENLKKQNNFGYVEDTNGNLQHVSEYELENNPSKYSSATWSPMKPSEVAKDRALVKPLGDVQMNLNHYRAAANAYSAARLPVGRVTQDQKDLNYILSAPQFNTAAEAHAGAGGIGMSIPTLAASLNADLANKVVATYNDLSPQGKALADNYARARAAIPAWVKALTNSGRGSKEQLEIELQNLLPPAYNISDIHNRLDGFQDNLDNQKKTIPQNLLGSQIPAPVGRADKAPAGAVGTAKGSDGVLYYVDANRKPIGKVQ